MRKILDNSFEDQFIKGLKNIKISKVKDIDLNFDLIKQRDKTARISRVASNSYKIEFSKISVAYDLFNLLRLGNPDESLEFSEDYVEFEPEEELIKKSKNPLWIVKVLKPGCVLLTKSFT